jgi:hypothetical protein
METAAVTTADQPAPFPLRDVEDLHDADLDGVLADALVDAGVAVASAGQLAGLVGRGHARVAVLAHTLSTRALVLAVR